MIAVEQGHEEVVRVILQQSKSDVHQAANDGVTTVFSLAKKNKDDKVLKLLQCREKFLKLGVIRFVRTCVGLKDEFYNRCVL